MSPHPPPSPGPDFASHATSVADFVIKLGAGLGALWVGVTKIAKPYTAWRRAHHRELTVEVLAPELKKLGDLTDLRELGQQILDGQQLILSQTKQVFREMDHFHSIATINNERLDELNLFLDAIGFASDRRSRSAEAQRKAVDELLARLRIRKLARDRGEPMTDTDEHPASPFQPFHPSGDTDL